MRAVLLQEDVVLLIHFSVMVLLGHCNVGLLTFHVRAHLQSCSWHSNWNILLHCLEAVCVVLQHVGTILRGLWVPRLAHATVHVLQNVFALKLQLRLGAGF